MGVGIDISFFYKFKFFFERGIFIFGVDEIMFNVIMDGGIEKSGFLRYEIYVKLLVDISFIRDSCMYWFVDEVSWG